MLTPSEMKAKMEELSGKDGYIDSIFNYCDRWCERCSFTSQCRNYAFGNDAPSGDSPELWDYLHNVFKATMLMLVEKMEEMGIDPENLPEPDEQSEPDPEKHPLFIKAKNAASKMHEWLTQHNPEETISDKYGIYNPGEPNSSRFKDSLEVIYWYNFFIPAKIARALSGLNLNEIQDIDYDSNGSAKIALIALDRIIAAWTVVMNRLTASEEEILGFLINLSAIRKQTGIVFPYARGFVRPGFDE
jgi:hypothetical protein